MRVALVSWGLGHLTASLDARANPGASLAVRDSMRMRGYATTPRDYFGRTTFVRSFSWTNVDCPSVERSNRFRILSIISELSPDRHLSRTLVDALSLALTLGSITWAVALSFRFFPR